MKELHIISPKDEPIVTTPGIPEQFRQYQLAGASSSLAETKFGKLLFHHFPGDRFDIWYSNYLIRESVVIAEYKDEPVLKLQIPFFNGFNTWWEGLGRLKLAERQFAFIYVPFMNTITEFSRRLDHHSFDIHFKKEILQPYANHSSKLADFLERVEKGKSANLLDMVQFISLDMARVIKAVLDYKFYEGLAGTYFTSLVHELLTLLTIQVDQSANQLKIPIGDLNKAEEVRMIILADFEVYHTVEQLARKVGTSELKLQLAFRHLYGITVFKFSREVRLAEGYRLLQTTNYPLRVVCTMVGYPDPGNFSVAFRSCFGFPPGEVQKRRLV